MTIPLAIVRSRPRHVGTRIIDAVRRWWRLPVRPRALRPRLWLDAPPKTTTAAMLCAIAHHGRALRRIDTPDASRPAFARIPPLPLPYPSDGAPAQR